MSNAASLAIVLLSAASAVLATLLTIFLTPRVQHYFWKYQRLAELRLTVINELNMLMAEFITNYIAHEGKEETYKPTNEFFQSLQVVSTQVHALFSDATWRIFKKMEEMIGPRLGPPGLPGTVDQFIRARDATFHALYKEAGFL